MLRLNDGSGALDKERTVPAVKHHPLVNSEDAAKLARMKIDHALLQHEIKIRLIAPEPAKKDVVRL